MMDHGALAMLPMLLGLVIQRSNTMKKAQKVHKKALRINVEKIRDLSDSELTGVAGGGASWSWDPCTHLSGCPCPT
jgi:hypothetical protein